MVHTELCKLCGNSYLNDSGEFVCKHGMITDKTSCDQEKRVAYEQIVVDLTQTEIDQLSSMAQRCGLDFDTYCSKLIEAFMLKQVLKDEVLKDDL